MIALFGLVKEDNGFYLPTRRTEELARTGDAKRFFKSFCHLFQWPGGFNKRHFTEELVLEGVAFKPCQYILSLLRDAINDPTEKYLTVPETCHLIFNDKRVTVEHEEPKQCWERIRENRINEVEYSRPSDLVRYPRDFLHFMCEASLLIERNGNFFINEKESDSINAIISSKSYYREFNEALEEDEINEDKFDAALKGWLDYFGGEAVFKEFETKVEDIIDISAKSVTVTFEDATVIVVEKAKKTLVHAKRKVPVEFLKTKSEKADKIGAIGEDIVLNYEKDFLAKNGKPNLAIKVENVSANAALGYDLESFNLNGMKKYIEVKTTETSDPEHPFILTSTQFNTAKELGESYSIYRVQIKSRTEFHISEFRNPYRLWEEKKLKLEPKDYWVFFSLK